MSSASPSRKQNRRKVDKIVAHGCYATVGLFLIALLLIVPITSMGYPQPPGRLVDVGSDDGDFVMHIYCTGEGNPTVVLDAGLGEMSLSWARVQEQVSEHTRVCSYDRAGMGWSDPGPKPRTYMRIADELNALLQAAGEQGPYVLVGHSSGAHTVRFFVQEYPTDVAGIVLEDAGYERILLNREETAVAEQVQRGIAFYANFGFWRYILSLELIRNLAQEFGVPISSIPPEVINNIEIYYSPKSIHTAADELAAIYETALALNATKVQGAWGDKPAIVLSADNEIARMVGLPEHHRELASLSTRGEHILVPSGHAIHYEHPEVVVEAILNIVTTVRQGT